MIIKFVNRKNIDIKKWNTAIENAKHKIIYGFSWYLDIMTENWGALIANDYDIILPIVYKKKWGQKYMYRAQMLQQNGFFCSYEITDKIFEAFINAIPKNFRLYFFNFSTSTKLSDKNLSLKTNYTLNLSSEYPEIYKNISTNTRRNIKKAEKNNLFVETNTNFKELIRFKKQISDTQIKANSYEKLKKLYNYAENHAKNECYFVQNLAGEIVATAYFILYKKRAYYLVADSLKSDKNKGAAFLIINHFIKKHATEDLTLDFEGSNIPGIARFFASWGSTEKQYYSYKKENLKLLKLLIGTPYK